MSNKAVFGEVLYDLPFVEAVERGLICDVSLVVQATHSDDVMRNLGNKAMTKLGVDLDTATRLTGVYNALHERRDLLGDLDRRPVEKAVFYTNRIRDSEALTKRFNALAARIAKDDQRPVEARHIDGTMLAAERSRLVTWLKKDGGGRTLALSNAQCLTQGVDVPALDAIVMMKPKKSQLEMVQAVGRATRRHRGSGKQRGFVIVPMVIRKGENAEAALRSSPDWKTLQQTISALRSHNRAFEVLLQQRYLKRTAGDSGGGGRGGDDEPGEAEPAERQLGIFSDKEIRDAVVGLVVKTSTSRTFWKRWGKTTAAAYADLRTRIAALDRSAPDVHGLIGELVEKLRECANRELTRDATIRMLAQHQICRRAFTALFGEERDRKEPPAAATLQEAMDTLEAHGLRDEVKGLETVYADIERTVAGVRGPEERQTIIRSLYDDFFQEAFKEEVGRMGIAYTPTPLIRYLALAADRKVRALSGGIRRLNSTGVHILDPFAGTGTVIARIIADHDLMDDSLLLETKIEGGEFHANEIELLAYYVACANIEQAMEERTGVRRPFRGGVLTNTFEGAESMQPALQFDPDRIEGNRHQRQRQRETPIRVIIGNPPWSAAKDPTETLTAIKERVAGTYAMASDSKNRNSLYDKYMLGLRWATDRLIQSPSNGGVIAFVLNNGWLTGAAAAGVRRTMMNEFSEIEILDLRGDARTRNWEAEGAKIFGEKSRAGVCLFVGVVDPGRAGAATVRYASVGEGWTFDDKVRFVDAAKGGASVEFKELTINEDGDWLNKRKAEWRAMTPLGDPASRLGRKRADAVFGLYSNGNKTGDDDRMYAGARADLNERMPVRIAAYNEYAARRESGSAGNTDGLVKWARELSADARRGRKHRWDPRDVRAAAYRPFIDKWVYFAPGWCSMLYRTPRMLPTAESENRLICVGGQGDGNELSAWMTDRIPDLGLLGKAQVFPEYRFDEKTGERHENVMALNAVRKRYNDPRISNADVFEFVYGRLHDPEYRRQFHHETSRDLPRIEWPATLEEFRDWAAGGQELAKLHLGWEEIAPYRLDNDSPQEKLHEQHHYRPERPGWLRGADRTRLRLNGKVTLAGVPPEAHEWKLAGTSALNGLVNAMKRLPDSGRGRIEETGDEKYWVHTLGRAVTVALETLRIVDRLPRTPRTGTAD